MGVLDRSSIGRLLDGTVRWPCWADEFQLRLLLLASGAGEGIPLPLPEWSAGTTVAAVLVDEAVEDEADEVSWTELVSWTPCCCCCCCRTGLFGEADEGGEGKREAPPVDSRCC